MEGSKNRHTIIVGIFISIGILILVIAVFTLGGQKNTFEKKFQLQAIFDDVGGLKVGDNVWISGVKVGAIKNISFTDSAHVIITMNIETRAKNLIHKDSKAKVGSDGLMGNRIIIIYGGSNNSSFVTDNDKLLSDRTTDSKDLLTTLETSNKNLAVITDNIKEVTYRLLNGKGTIPTLINDNDIPENIRATLSTIKYAAADLKKTAGQSQVFMNNLSAFSERLNKEGTSLNNLLTDTILFKNISAGIQQLSSTIDTVKIFSENIKKASEDLNEKNNLADALLRDSLTAIHFKRIVENLDSASSKLDEDLQALQHNFLLRGYFRKKQKQK